MRISSKVILWAWVVLFIVFSAFVVTAYNKLNPDSLVTLFNKQIQRSYPGSNLTIGEIDYGISVDFKLTLKTLMLTRGEKTLASASEVQLKVPWWLVLLNRGNAQVNISNLIVYVSTTKEASGMPAKADKVKSTTVTVDVPSYLLDAKYTLRAKNISVRELGGDRNYFTLSKLLVREFQYEKNSAFELNIPITITHKSKRYTSDLWLFGDVTPSLDNWALNYRGEFKTRETAEGLQFEELVIDGKSVFTPSTVDFSSVIDLSVDRKKVGSGDITIKDQNLHFNLKFSHFPMDYLNLIGDEIKNPFLQKIYGVAEGEIKFTRSFNQDNASLSAKLQFPGPFTLGKDHQIVGNWHLGFENEKWETSFITPKKEVSFFRRAVLNFDESKVTQYSQEVEFNSYSLEGAMKAIDPLSAIWSDEPLTYHSTFVSLKNCLDGDRQVSGSFRYGVSPYEKFYQAELTEDVSRFTLKYLGKSSSQKLEITAQQFSWLAAYSFLSPYFQLQEGILNGKLEGNWSSHWSEGTWLAAFSVDKISGENGEFFELNKSVWNHFTIDPATGSKRSWNVSVKNKTILLTSLLLEGNDHISLNGALSTAPKMKSYLTLTYPKNKKWKPVKKDVSEVFWKKETP